MPAFHAQRISHHYTQINDGPPERVFPLLCPVREAEWVPDWQYRLIHSRSGVAEEGCVFTTPNERGPETTWVVTEYDPAAHRIAFVWIRPGLVACQLRIALTEMTPQKTQSRIYYTYTGLSPEGNLEVERYTEEWFQEKMKHWEAAINHYLLTSRKIETGAWE